MRPNLRIPEGGPAEGNRFGWLRLSTGPVADADLIVLSEHVDYWNSLGWADPFSPAQFTQRQRDYVKQLHLGGACIPELVVDGERDVVGSDSAAARAAIVEAISKTKPVIDVSAQRSGDKVKIAEGWRSGPWHEHLRGTGGWSRSVASDPRRKLRRTLSHVVVVRKKGWARTFHQRSDITLTKPAQRRVVVLLRNSVSRQILGAAQTRV